MCSIKKTLPLSINKGTLILNLNTVQCTNYMKKTMQWIYSLMQKKPQPKTKKPHQP